jgi:hypothetical protein
MKTIYLLLVRAAKNGKNETPDRKESSLLLQSIVATRQRQAEEIATGASEQRAI